MEINTYCNTNKITNEYLSSFKINDYLTKLKKLPEKWKLNPFSQSLLCSIQYCSNEYPKYTSANQELFLSLEHIFP